MKKLFLILVLSILIIGCKQNVVSTNRDFTTSYDYSAFTERFLPVTDKDDIDKLKKTLPKFLNMDDLGKNYTIELITMRTGGYRKNKKIGINVFKVELSNFDKNCFERQSFIQCLSSINSNWYNSNFINTIRSESKQINSRNFFFIERKLNADKKNLHELIAFTVEKNYLYIFELYSKEKNYKKSSKTLLTILENLKYDEINIHDVYEKSESGFFTGLWHGAVWLFRFGYSWTHHYDVWSDNNSGFGYVIGFIIGLVFLGGLGNSVGGGSRD